MMAAGGGADHGKGTMSASREPVVRARGLKKHFGAVTAVDGIDFEIYRGECFAFLGPNGAGKTSTMRMLYDFSPRDGGELEVFGLDPARQGVRVRQVLGVVPQADNLDQELTVRENLEVYGGYYGLNGARLRRRIDELLELVELQSRQHDVIRALSGGMKRRLTLVRALLHEPRMVVLDEPSTGLDPAARHQIWESLRELAARGVTLVLTTHYMEEAERLCDRLVIMDHGRILQEGAPRELIRRHLPELVMEVSRRELQPGWEQAGVPFERYGEQVFFMADREEEFSRVALQAGGRRRVIRPANLEDLFLKLTGRAIHA